MNTVTSDQCEVISGKTGLPVPFVAKLLVRHEMIERFYMKLEEYFPQPRMTEGQVKEMNEALGLEKDADYRPYCCREGCKDMPRMFRVPDGFRCWSCHNEIDFSLKRKEEAAE